MNFYTLAAKMNRSIKKEAFRLELADIQYRAAGLPTNTTDHYTAQKEVAMQEFRANAELGIELMLEFKSIAQAKGLYSDNLQRTYFLTIRPNTSDITFADFFALVSKFLQRKCFKTYTVSFEQKGTTEETYGHGFHVHIVAEMVQRSKTEVLRDTVSTFKSCTAANCIQVDLLRTESDKTNTLKYITEYTSDDDHKIVTKEHDALWRTIIGIADIYTNNNPLPSGLPIKSVRQANLSIDLS